MVGTFFIVSDLKPYKWPTLLDARCTDDKHVMEINLGSNKLSKSEIEGILRQAGAEEVNEKSI
jgi:hypothetical protein